MSGRVMGDQDRRNAGQRSAFLRKSKYSGDRCEGGNSGGGEGRGRTRNIIITSVSTVPLTA